MVAGAEPTMPVYRDADCDVGKLLGEGTFAQVFSGELMVEGGKKKAVAFKVVKPETMIDFQGCEGEVGYEDVIEAFRTECSLLVAIGSHPNVVPVLGVVDTGEVLVMEKATTDLTTAIKAARGGKGGCKRLPRPLVCSWVQDILRGVDFIHENGVIHQDMKTSNILISRDGTAQICDFGLSCAGSERMVVDREISTLWYRAAEVLMGSTTYTKKVDEWGVGCILLEMLVGKPVFHGDPAHACSCEVVSHCNFNADQIHQIFQVVGSPSASTLRGMTCAPHFREWDQYSSVIPEIVEEVCASSPAPKEEARGWGQLLTGLLELNPARRLSARVALGCDLFHTPEASCEEAAKKHAAHAAEVAAAGVRRDQASPDPTVLDGAFALNDALAPAQPPAARGTLACTCSTDHEDAGQLCSTSQEPPAPRYTLARSTEREQGAQRAMSPLQGRAEPVKLWGTFSPPAAASGVQDSAQAPGRECMLQGEARRASGDRHGSPSSLRSSPRTSPGRGRVPLHVSAGLLGRTGGASPCGSGGGTPVPVMVDVEVDVVA